MKEETILDFAAFQLSPKKSRFELYLCGDGETEKYGPVTLEPLLLHLPAAKDVFTGSKHVFKLALPEHESSASWFSKGTVTRFICLADNPEILEAVNTIHDEITQLETARSFNVMLHSQRKEDYYRLLQATEVHDSEDPSLTVTQIAAADATRNDLLRAMEARLMTLSQELDAALGHASATGFSVTEAANLMQFSQRFGATRLRDACAKFIASHHHQQRHDTQSTAQHKTTLSQQSAASSSTQTQTQSQSQSMDMDDENEDENTSIHDNDDDISTKQDNFWALSSSLCWRSKGRGSSPSRLACTSNTNANASLFKTRPTPNTSTIASSNSKNKRDTGITTTTTSTTMFPPHTTTSDSHNQSSAQKQQQQQEEEEEDCDKSQDRDPIPNSRSRSSSSSSRRLSVHDAVSIFESKESLDQKQQQQQRSGYWRNSRLQNKSMITETEKVKRPTRSYNNNNNNNTAAATMHTSNRGSCGIGEMVSFSHGLEPAMQSMNEDDDADYRQKIQLGQTGQAATDVSSSFATSTNMHQTCQSWHQADCQLTATLLSSHNGRGGGAMNDDISLNFLRKDDDELCSLPVSATNADMGISYSQEVNYPTFLGKLSGSQSCTGEGQNGLSRRQRKESEMQQMLVTMVNNSNSHRKDGGASSETQRRSNQMKGRFYDEYRQRREAKIREEHAGVRAEKRARLKAMHETLQKRKAEMMLASLDKHASVSQRPTRPLKSSSQTREPMPKKKMEQDVIINDLKNIINRQEGNINRVAAGNYQNDRTSTTSLSSPEPTGSKKTKSKLSPVKYGTVPPLSSSKSAAAAAAAKTVVPRASINKNSSTVSKPKSANSTSLPRSSLASVPDKFLRHSGPLCSTSSAMPMPMSSSSRQSCSSRSPNANANANASANRVGRRASSSQSQHISASTTCAASSTVKQGVKTRDKPLRKNSSSSTESETRNSRTFKKSSATKKSTVVPLEQKADDSNDAQKEDVHVDHASFIGVSAAAVDTTLDFSSATDGAGEFKTDATLDEEPLNSQGFGEVHDHPGGSRITENKDTHEQKDYVPDSTEILPILKEELPIENVKHIPLIPEDAAHRNLLSRVENPSISISGGTTHNQDDPTVTSSVLLETPTLVESDSRPRPSGSVDTVGKETASTKTLNLHVKHSLTQMRISSSSEAVVDESIKKQEVTRKPELVSPRQTLKDGPKGLKRFLKFGKKRQGETVVAALASTSASAILESQNDEKALAGQTASCSNRFGNLNAVEECFSDKKHIKVVPSASSKDSAGLGLSLLKAPRSFFLATFKNKSNNSKPR